MAQKFTGTFLTEMRKGGEIGWVLFKTDRVEYASAEAMEKVKQDTYSVWLDKYNFEDVDREGGTVTAVVSPVCRLRAEFATN